MAGRDEEPEEQSLAQLLGGEEAIEEMMSEQAVEQEDIERFLNEVRTAAQLEHPNIVTAFEAGEDDGYYFMAMAYVNGESLASRLKREQRIKSQRDSFAQCRIEMTFREQVISVFVVGNERETPCGFRCDEWQ